MSFYKYGLKYYMQEFNSIRENLKCYFDVSIEKKPVGRMVFLLYAKECPKTALNFYHICKGDKINPKTNKPLSYKLSNFHRIIPAFMCQGGDIISGDGKGSASIYGDTFADENFLYSHDKPGMLSMANRGPNTNGSQFFITTSDCAWYENINNIL
jgi:cyclophilin family peptidyl-prolyl cis-trans isomerase